MMSNDEFSSPPPNSLTNPNPNSPNPAKRKRNLPGNPDPDAEVIALSPKSLMATNRFVCEICSKGFQRDQNLQLHKRGHNLPWKLKQRNINEVVRKKVYICPEKSCIHHDPSRALGDLTGVKKHFSRKHGEKKWKCERCLKKYAVQSDWKAHSKICGTREYKCDCGTLFSRKDSFITHRAFCDALMEENSRTVSFPLVQTTPNINFQNNLMLMNGGNRIMNMHPPFPDIFGVTFGSDQKDSDGNELKPKLPIWLHHHANNNPLENPTTSSSFLGSLSSNNNNNNGGILYNSYNGGCSNTPPIPPPPHMSATALLQKASQMGHTRSTNSDGFGLMNSKSDQLSGLSSFRESKNLSSAGMMNADDGLMMMMMAELKQKSGGVVDSGEGNFTRDFLGVEEKDRRAFSLQQDLIDQVHLFH